MGLPAIYFLLDIELKAESVNLYSKLFTTKKTQHSLCLQLINQLKESEQRIYRKYSIESIYRKNRKQNIGNNYIDNVSGNLFDYPSHTIHFLSLADVAF